MTPKKRRSYNRLVKKDNAIVNDDTPIVNGSIEAHVRTIKKALGEVIKDVENIDTDTEKK